MRFRNHRNYLFLWDLIYNLLIFQVVVLIGLAFLILDICGFRIQSRVLLIRILQTATLLFLFSTCLLLILLLLLLFILLLINLLLLRPSTLLELERGLESDVQVAGEPVDGLQLPGERVQAACAELAVTDVVLEVLLFVG